ncbi:allose kinase [Mycoplasmatota bacterium WC30]
MSRVLGIDIGGTHVRYGVVNDKFVSSVEKLFTKDIKDFTTFIVDLASKHKNIDVISIGVPGIVKNNKIVSIPNIKSLEIENLDTELNIRTKKIIIINKDVNLLFANDLDRLNLAQAKNVLGFYLGTGLGNSIRVDGKILRGNNGFAGELGHIPIIGNEKVCTCGKTGCSETIVSGKALIEIYEAYINDGNFKEMFINHRANQYVKKFIKNFALIISMEVNIFDTTKIIIGGGVVNMSGFPKQLVREYIEKELRSDILVKELEVYFVDDSPINSIIGASLITKES